jgi:dTDP-4-dehydrorhamnose reductase
MASSFPGLDCDAMSLLVTGASGLLGANLVLAARDAGWSITAVSKSSPFRLAGTLSYAVDLSEPGVAARLFGHVHPRIVIHTAAGTNVDRCEADPEYATRLNHVMAREVAIAARAVGARLIHISTDAVFGMSRQDAYAEEDPTGPCNSYGRSKLAGEAAVIAVDPASLVVRTTIYGWNAQSKASLAEYFVERFRRGEPAQGFVDAWMAPILVNDLADRLLRLAKFNTRGILHVTGRECITKAEFGRRLAREFGFNPNLVLPVSIAEAGLGAMRPRRACLRVSRAEALLGNMPTADEGIARLRQLEEAGIRAQLRHALGGAS